MIEKSSFFSHKTFSVLHYVIELKSPMLHAKFQIIGFGFWKRRFDETFTIHGHR